MKIVIDATQGTDWVDVDPVGESDMLGSLTDVTNGVDVLLFGWRDGVPGIWRVVGGGVKEFGQLREITTSALELVSDLSEPYECPVVHPHMGLMRVRWMLVE
jgi:hypothetical protein